MRWLGVILIVAVIFSGCVFQGDSPEIALSMESPPDELIVSEVYELSIELTNEGTATAFQVSLESNIPAMLTFEENEIAELKEGVTKKIKATLEAVDILKETRDYDQVEAVIKVKYFDADDNQKTTKTSFEFVLRKPVVNIDKLEAGLLPGKISAKEHEKVPISVYVKNEESRKMENLHILFCTDYEHVEIYRVDIEEVGSCFEYAITDVLWLNDLLAKGFTLEASLPQGANEVTFVLVIKLVWRTDGYDIVLDQKEIKVEIKAD
ncbi:MAG: hypothetical protein HXS41_01945 [Theionarchaea archaeon]|nr:hypothetical protein [Theionarchaea archaeon]MBU7017148.1 hypothetical protein [Theionarchaea archaeon]MBU7019792.1 hypothetical protein [Theionarchaea archaeon]MBU7035577.1 hypothetical protein [Theionarchaea archaeon]MBU7041222.1 hypothetical protein [Theionarchaea archaeon]